MWRVIDYGTAERDDGTKVERTGYRTLKYERGGRELSVAVEAGDKDLGVYARSIDFWDLPERLPIDQEERTRILDDIKSALRALSVPFSVLWD